MKGKMAMHRVDNGDEKGEKSRRGKDSPLDHEVEAGSLGWAVRWVDNSNLHKRLHEPSFEHLFHC
jgi:hypothetical protein